MVRRVHAITHYALRGVYVAAVCGVCVGVVLVFRTDRVIPRGSIAQGTAVVAGAPDSVVSTQLDVRGTVLAKLDHTFRSQEEVLIKQGEPYLLVDLDSKSLSLLRGDETLSTYRMLATGGVLPWRHAAPGVYSVQDTEPDHLVGGAHYPWSIQFGDTCAIHGWPYDAAGTPLTPAAVDGCIRLATSDARSLFGDVRVGMPVIVRAHRELASSTPYALRAVFSPPSDARAYLAVDLASGYVFTGSATTHVFPIASITKLVTALVALESLPLDERVSVPSTAIVYTSKPRLHEGESVRGYGLISPLLRESSNEAAHTLAHSVGSDIFVGRMNARMASLGLTSTSFVDPAGSSEKNVSSAEDLAALLGYLYHSRREVLDVTASRGASAFVSTFGDLGNFNHFAADPVFIGGKTGKTNAARETMAAVFELRIGSVVRPVAFVVLGTDDARRFIEALRSHVGLAERVEGEQV